jgi:predicted Rossmann fold nucleotide-binding protein DprA/Smf involved in DNA uptake
MNGLTPDTQATLLLTGRLGGGESKPLRKGEYNALANELHERGLRPGGLLDHIPDGLRAADKERLGALLGRGTALAFAVERWSQLGIEVISRSDPVYPQQLKKQLRGGAAPILYGVGDWALLNEDAVCIVGSRDATEGGLHFAREAAMACAAERLVVVSGDARGVDREAMAAALDAGGKVVGVIAEALGKAALSKRYRRPIMDGQVLLMSPYDPDSRFTVANAMDRNKYMYALSIVAMVVDSDEKGGTWAGALENLKHGWTPAFVRMDAEAGPGNARLADLGVIPIPHHGFGRGSSIRDLAASNAMKAQRTPKEEDLPLFARQETDSTGSASKSEESAELFAFFLQRLKAGLKRTPKSEMTIAEEFGLEPIQVQRWLKQATAAHVVTQISDSGHFVLTEEPTRPSR